MRGGWDVISMTLIGAWWLVPDGLVCVPPGIFTHKFISQIGAAKKNKNADASLTLTDSKHIKPVYCFKKTFIVTVLVNHLIRYLTE